MTRLRALWAALDLQPLLAKLGGRSYLLVTFFAVTGFWLEWHGKLTADYAGLVTALSGFHVWRSVMQDRTPKS